MKLFLATRNEHKVKEIKEILKNENIELIIPNNVPEVVEDKNTLKANAIKKALALYKLNKENGITTPVIADDSGLFVEALNGAPGIYTARYAGENATHEENIEKLLNNLSTYKNKRATFQTVIAICYDENNIKTFKGVTEGKIIQTPKGNGFAYDPYFYIEGVNKTLAELPLNTVHNSRTKALKKFLEGEKMKIIKRA